jgi:hypothetical protein
MFDEAIRMVGAGVQVFDGASTGRVVLVTSVAPAEGKSVFVQALADVIVMSGQRGPGTVTPRCDLPTPSQNTNSPPRLTFYFVIRYVQRMRKPTTVL